MIAYLDIFICMYNVLIHKGMKRIMCFKLNATVNITRGFYFNYCSLQGLNKRSDNI